MSLAYLISKHFVFLCRHQLKRIILIGIHLFIYCDWLILFFQLQQVSISCFINCHICRLFQFKSFLNRILFVFHFMPLRLLVFYLLEKQADVMKNMNNLGRVLFPFSLHLFQREYIFNFLHSKTQRFSFVFLGFFIQLWLSSKIQS